MRKIVKNISQKLLKLDLLFLCNGKRFNSFIEHSDLTNESDTDEIIDAIKLTVPVGCSKPLIRIGGDKDGAYLIPNDLNDIDACFSPGTDYTKSFEDELAKKYQIKSFMSDASVKTSSLKLIEGYQFFQEKWISDFNYKNTMTLSNWIKSVNLDNPKNLILQMDIEGSEYSSLIQTSESCLKKFKILAIEFHNLDYLKNERFLNQRFVPVLRRILQNFDCVHAHANNASPCFEIGDYKIPRTLELTFYRKDCNHGEKKRHIPHKKDIVNAPSHPPIVLGKPWT